jgi:alginate O-acetyltransferase complex protein AlgJ
MPSIHRLHSILFAALVLLTSAFALQRAGSFKTSADSADILEGKLSHAFESHYDQVFPGRTFAINLWAAIDYKLFREGHEGVVVGRGGWLYSDEEFRLGNGADDEVARNLTAIADVRDQLSARGVQLLVAVVPAKARIYPEHLRRSLPPAAHASAYGRVQAMLQARAIPNAELLTPLRLGSKDAETYLRTDTHWTPYGARIAAAAIAEAIKPLGLPAIPAQKFRGVVDGRAPHHGDLLNFLPMTPWFASLLPPPDALERTHTEAPVATGDLLGDAPAPRIALVGTSYSANPLWDFPGALQQALKEPVANYAKDGVGPFAPMQAYLASADLRDQPPRLVIWELPERYLPTHQSFDGAAPAPSAASNGERP